MKLCHCSFGHSSSEFFTKYNNISTIAPFFSTYYISGLNICTLPALSYTNLYRVDEKTLVWAVQVTCPDLILYKYLYFWASIFNTHARYNELSENNTVMSYKSNKSNTVMSIKELPSSLEKRYMGMVTVKIWVYIPWAPQKNHLEKEEIKFASQFILQGFLYNSFLCQCKTFILLILTKLMWEII